MNEGDWTLGSHPPAIFARSLGTAPNLENAEADDVLLPVST